MSTYRLPGGSNWGQASKRYPQRFPADAGFKGWTHDPAQTLVSSLFTANVSFYTRVLVPAGEVITNTHLYLGSAGAGVVGGGMAVYDAATGVKLGATATITTAWQSIGLKTHALTSPIAAVDRDRWVYVGYTVGTSTTVPGVQCLYTAVIGGVNIDTASPNKRRRSMYILATALPAGPIDWSTGTDWALWWAALS